jgi:hypothetical protein
MKPSEPENFATYPPEHYRGGGGGRVMNFARGAMRSSTRRRYPAFPFLPSSGRKDVYGKKFRKERFDSK